MDCWCNGMFICTMENLGMFYTGWWFQPCPSEKYYRSQLGYCQDMEKLKLFQTANQYIMDFSCDITLQYKNKKHEHMPIEFKNGCFSAMLNHRRVDGGCPRNNGECWSKWWNVRTVYYCSWANPSWAVLENVRRESHIPWYTRPFTRVSFAAHLSMP